VLSLKSTDVSMSAQLVAIYHLYT